MNSWLYDIAEEQGTPSFVFDISSLKNRMALIKDLTGDTIHLCYSIKANPFLIPAMLDCVKKLEVCSPGELDICKYYKVPADKIIYSGVNKTAQNIKDAFLYNVNTYTAESILQVLLLEKQGEQSDSVLPVLLRLNAGSQFGMSKEDLFFVIKNKSLYPHICITGIHYFAGTQRKRPSDQQKDIELLKEIITEIKNLFDFDIQKIEYGPGFPFPYFEGDDFTDTLEPLKAVISDLKELAQKVELTIEMGRFFVSECGIYLTKVMDTKSNAGTDYVILDGGINHLSYLGQLMGMKIPVIELLTMANKDNKQNKEQTLCGSLCTTADVLVRKVSMPALNQGDILAFRNCGAYSVTEGMYLFLSRTMPKILLFDSNAADNNKIVIARNFMESSLLNHNQQ